MPFLISTTFLPSPPPLFSIISFSPHHIKCLFFPCPSILPPFFHSLLRFPLILCSSFFFFTFFFARLTYIFYSLLRQWVSSFILPLHLRLPFSSLLYFTILCSSLIFSILLFISRCHLSSLFFSFPSFVNGIFTTLFRNWFHPLVFTFLFHCPLRHCFFHFFLSSLLLTYLLLWLSLISLPSRPIHYFYVSF